MKLFWFAIAILFSLPVILVYGETESENDILLNKASQHLKLGEYEEAISYYDQILETNPNHVQALFDMGFSLSMLEKFEESIPYYERVLNIEPYNQLALFKLQDALLRITDYFYRDVRRQEGQSQHAADIRSGQAFLVGDGREIILLACGHSSRHCNIPIRPPAYPLPSQSQPRSHFQDVQPRRTVGSAPRWIEPTTAHQEISGTEAGALSEPGRAFRTWRDVV